MNVYRVTSYHCDENGKPFGEPFQHIVYTDELMETYKNKKYVEKIEDAMSKAPIPTKRRKGYNDEFNDIDDYETSEEY